MSDFRRLSSSVKYTFSSLFNSLITFHARKERFAVFSSLQTFSAYTLCACFDYDLKR
jgi:hypothetical protein